MEKSAHDLPPPLEAEPVVQLRGGGTIIRVKRKRNEQPLDALVIVGMMPPTKRAAFDALSSAFASLSTSAVEGAPRPAQEQAPPQPTRRLYRLAHTTKSTKEDETKTALDRIEDIKQKRKRTLEVPKEEKSKHTVQQKQEQTRTARLKVVERHRTKAGTIVDVAVERDSAESANTTTTTTGEKMPRPIYTKPTTTRKLPSARRQGARFVPNLAASKTQEQVHESEMRKRQEASPFAGIDDETTFSQYLPMVKSYLAEVKGKEKLDEDDEYEYDLYYFDDTADRAELDKDYGVVHIETFDEDLVAGNEYDESEEEYDSEDSNDENNPNYDYPEESDSDSEANGEPEEGLSDLSSDDERQTNMIYWQQQQQQREEFSKFAYEEGMGDEDDIDDDGAFDDDDNGIVPPPMIQPDFAFFQNWRAMRK